MTDKMREEFEKWYRGKMGCDISFLVFTGISEGGYRDEDIEFAFEAFQAAYNLREQEVQRLRRALNIAYDELKDLCNSIDAHNCVEPVIGQINGIRIRFKQALQQDLTATKE